MKKITSNKYEFVYEDLKKALFNALVHGSPLLLIILIAIQNGNSFEDIKVFVGAWIIQAGIDLTRKFISVNTYQRKT